MFRLKVSILQQEFTKVFSLPCKCGFTQVVKVDIMTQIDKKEITQIVFETVFLISIKSVPCFQRTL